MLEFATRGTNEIALTSRKICGNIKAGKIEVINRLIYHIQQLAEDHPISLMFENDPILVPAPRSTPIVEGGHWPTKILANEFVKSGLGESVLELLVRNKPVPRSSAVSSADQRPTCSTHYESISTPPPAAFISKIIIIDDVFTLGRTSCACARRLKETYPDAEVYIFAAMRTRGFLKELDYIVKPSYHTMVYKSEYDSVSLPN